jgi:hypothetical protein
MPLLTELENVLGCDSTNMSPLTGLFWLAALPRRSSRCDFFWTFFFAGRKVKVVKRKLAEWATASHVEKHTPVSRAKPAAAPAK